jgi:hypothetical protein
MNKIILILSLSIASFYCNAEVITCSDATSVGSEASLSLHASAQKRAQVAVENLLEKKIMTPYVDLAGGKATLKSMSSLIETYWCESPSTPLHSAYFRFYTNNKNVFQ